jgi:hypothetical protein
MKDAVKLSAEDRFSLLDLIHQFYRLVDGGRASETAVLFSANGSLTFGVGSPKPGTISGAEIALAMRDRERLTDVTARHVISNVVFAQESDGKFSAHYLMTLFRADAGPRTTVPAFVADIDEIFARTEDGFRIFTRIITPVFSRQ